MNQQTVTINIGRQVAELAHRVHASSSPGTNGALEATVRERLKTVLQQLSTPTPPPQHPCHCSSAIQWIAAAPCFAPVKKLVLSLFRPKVRAGKTVVATHS